MHVCVCCSGVDGDGMGEGGDRGSRDERRGKERGGQLRRGTVIPCNGEQRTTERFRGIFMQKTNCWLWGK